MIAVAVESAEEPDHHGDAPKVKEEFCDGVGKAGKRAPAPPLFGLNAYHPVLKFAESDNPT
jgi:hypothetical protein